MSTTSTKRPLGRAVQIDTAHAILRGIVREWMKSQPAVAAVSQEAM